MKTLTLTQPWASLVALGQKNIETRSWRTSYRGPLAIHAAKGMSKEDKELCFTDPFFGALTGLEPRNYSLRGARELNLRVSNLPRGQVIATCRLVGCESVDKHCFNVDGLLCTLNEPHGRSFEMTEKERAFGNYDVGCGRFAWILADIRAITPVPARGHLSLWNWDV